MAWLAVLLIVFTHATSDATRDFVATTEPTQCCIDGDGYLGPTTSGMLGGTYCDPGSHMIHFSPAFGTTCSTDKWNEAKEKAVDGFALDEDILTLVDWVAMNHHKYVHEGADVVLAGMVEKLKIVHEAHMRKREQEVRNEKDKESVLRVAKGICGATFAFGADSQDVQTRLAKSDVSLEAKASLKELPGCELALACTAAFHADAGIDDMVNGVDTSATGTWAVACESLASSHTKCFKQVKKTLNETYVVVGKPNPKPRAEWWFREAYPLGHWKEGNKQAREMLEKIGTLKARAAAFEKLAITNGDGNCVGSVPVYKSYKAENLKDLPKDVGDALSGERVGDDDHQERLQAWMYDVRPTKD